MMHHLRVRRITQQFTLFNERDGAFTCVREHDHALVGQHVAPPWPSPKRTLLAPMIKSKNFALMLAKASELGVTCFIPIISQHSQVKDLNVQRMTQICLEAIEQCERFTPPVVHPPQALATAIAHITQPTLVALERHDSPTPHPNLTSIHALLIGPEGGFSADERSLINQHPLCIPYNFGRAILRAETAALYGLSLLSKAHDT